MTTDGAAPLGALARGAARARRSRRHDARHRAVEAAGARRARSPTSSTRIAGDASHEPTLALPRSAAAVQATVALQGTRLVTSIVALRIAPATSRASDRRAAAGARRRRRRRSATTRSSRTSARGARSATRRRARSSSGASRRRGRHVGVATGRSRSTARAPPARSSIARPRSRASAERAECSPTPRRASSRAAASSSRCAATARRWSARRSSGKRGEGRRRAVRRARGRAHAIVAAYERCADESTPVIVTVVRRARHRQEPARAARFVARVAERTRSPPRIVVVRSESFGRGQRSASRPTSCARLLGVAKGARSKQARSALARCRPRSIAKKRARRDARELLARLVANEALPRGLDPRGARDALWLAMTELRRATAPTASPAVHRPRRRAVGRPRVARAGSITCSAAPAAPALRARCWCARAFWRDKPTRFAGRDHVRIELRPISRRAARAIAKAILGDEPPTRRCSIAIAAQAAGSPLFAEELARLTALGRDAHAAPTIEAAIQVSLDALDDAARDAVVRLSVFGLSGWDAGLAALGVTIAGASRSEARRAPSCSSSSRIALRGRARVGLQARAGARRRVRLARRGAQEELHAAAGRWLAKMGEDAATVAQALRARRQARARPRCTGRRRRGARSPTNALSDAVAHGRARARLRRGQADRRSRARSSSTRRGAASTRARASARRRSARWKTTVFDEASRAARRWARALATTTRAAPAPTIERAPRRGARERAARSGSSTRRRAARDARARATRSPASSTTAEREADAPPRARRDARDRARAAVDAWQTLAVVRQTRGELGGALEARRNARARRAARRACRSARRCSR